MRVAGAILAGLVLAVLLGAVSAHLPERVKLLGLFSIAVGLATGAGLGWLGRESQVPPTPLVVAGLTLAVLAGQLALSAEAYRQHVEFWNEHFRSEPMSSSLPDFTEDEIAAMPTDSQGVAKQIMQAKKERREKTSLAEWLRRRLSPTFTSWPESGYLAWWIGEVILATVAGTILGSRQLRADRAGAVVYSGSL